jgi:4-hydroxybenzoate polyprenyltransferase
MGLAYSVKPFEFKVKGIMHTISLMISAFLVPLILLFSAVGSNFTWYIILLSIGFPIAHYGIALANQTGDFLEDRSEGLQSPAVKWGLNNTLKMAKVMAIIGLGIELIAIWGLIWIAPWIPQLNSMLALPFSIKYLVIILISIIILLGYSVSIRGLFKLHDISKWDTAIENRMNKIKEIMNYPIWQASAIWGLVITSLIISGLNIGLAS